VDKKDANHYSSTYGSWMPWAIHVSGAYWIHEGYLPGDSASHGCIRLRKTDATWYFTWATIGGVVSIVP